MLELHALHIDLAFHRLWLLEQLQRNLANGQIPSILLRGTLSDQVVQLLQLILPLFYPFEHGLSLLAQLREDQLGVTFFFFPALFIELSLLDLGPLTLSLAGFSLPLPCLDLFQVHSLCGLGGGEPRETVLASSFLQEKHTLVQSHFF
mmetsp:Transcript_24283/g.23890  ORF Transcript_24283/g.23890 Transcript_24283/m.23890 type:complete len:148 (-) Transcript_24283:15-458(-)